MKYLETNIFPITNLSELSTSYRLYKIRGLKKNHPEYFQNRQFLIRRLSYALKNPVTIIDLENTPHLVLPDNVEPPVSPYSLVRSVVYFEPTGEARQLDYTLRNLENDEICLRFIRFMLQAPLTRNLQLWQPGSGKPFFEKQPIKSFGLFNHYQGFVVRPVITKAGGIGLCIDIKNKFVACKSLPTHLSKLNYQKYRNKHCIYHYGHQWYEIKLDELSDLNVSQFMIVRDGKHISLLDYVVAESQKPIPQDLASVPFDGSAIHYFNNQDETRAAPAALCYPVFDTEDKEVSQYHNRTILPPYLRRQLIQKYQASYLNNLSFNEVNLQISSTPEKNERKIFFLPDYEFGNNYKLSVRKISELPQASLENIGRKRAELLRDKKAGFHVNERFGRQYLLLPQTVFDSFGSQFVKDLKRIVNQMYPSGGGYEPKVFTYNDRNQKTFLEQGRAILAAAEQHNLIPGWGVVMIHHTSDHQSRQHDQLEAMVVREFRERFDVYTSVIHSAVGKECYELVLSKNANSKPRYQIRKHKKSKCIGYLRNVALNKVLLTNERWPFVLATPLHADITIGIDVKQNTAGFTIIGRHGAKIQTICHTSKQKERLLAKQVKKYLIEIIEEEVELSGETIESIVIHRDGRLFQSERDGANEALELLKQKNIIATNATLTILEISKSSPAPLRFFEVTDKGGKQPWVENPKVGCFEIINGVEGYICSTGRPFLQFGTVEPLHVRFIEGAMPFEKCLEDVYCLTALAWMRPETCMRNPITIKLNDRRLGEAASVYDADALKFDLYDEMEESA